MAGSRPCPETPKTGRSVDETSRLSRLREWRTDERPSRHWRDRVGSMQARAALGSAGVSQQAFEHETGVRVGGVMPARVTPSSEIPIDGAGACDQVHDGADWWGGQSASSECAGSSHVLGFVIVSPRPSSICARGMHPNGQPGHSVVGPGLAPIRCQQLFVRHSGCRVGSPLRYWTFVA